MSQRTDEDLRLDKEELLALLLQDPDAQKSGAAICRRPENSHPPLSFAQQRFWFFDRLSPNSAAFNIPLAFRLKGRLNTVGLELALNGILQRHEVLRTNFAVSEDLPVQRVNPPPRAILPIVNLHENQNREKTAHELLVKEANRPFDLSRDQLLRAKLFKLSADDHMLQLTLHHTVADGSSLGILCGELAALYDTFSAGLQPALPELPVQYADFALWQRRQLASGACAPELGYWKEKLSGTLPILELPVAKPRPAELTFHGATRSIVLPHALSQALRELSRRENATLFMTVLAAFKTLLFRYTGHVDILVGTPVSNRSRRELEGLIGVFINTLVLRSDLSGDPSFQELLVRVRETTSSAYANEAVPFEKLVEELAPERQQNRNAIFQFLFVAQKEAPPLELRGLRVTPLRMLDSMSGSIFDLTMVMIEEGEEIRIAIEYNSDLFEYDTIQRMLDQFQTLLENIAARPQTRISVLPMLTVAESSLLEQWNQTRADYPREKCVHRLVEEQAARTPEAVAVSCNGRELRFAELNARANQLAGLLLEMGARAETLIAVAMDRSPEMIVTLLAVLKSGAAYLPLDPAYPLERLKFTLADARARILLTQSHLLGQLGAPGVRTLCLDKEWASISQRPAENPDCTVSAENLAYAIYTSGSTGKPKGVPIVHRAVVNFLESMRQVPGISASDVVLGLTTISFDIAGLEIFLPLVSGARMELIGRDEAQDGERLAAKIENSKATIVQATPATWQMLLSTGWKGSPRLKLLCGGETLTRELAARLLERSSAVYNMYGPTETTIWSSCARVLPGAPISIGRPIANTEIHILNGALQPAPAGIPGELYIGGDGLSRGYLNRPEQTAQRFVPHPFGNEKGRLLYRTGDLARLNLDGTLEVLGRIDQQVKIRGFRIELEEIEAVLSRHPAVRQCVVVARADASGQKSLAAYVVLTETKAENTGVLAKLREHLARELAEYMIPAAFKVMDALPLTPTGKVDRNALPEPDDTRSTLETGYAAPRTPVEEILANVWREVLKVERLGIHDNFFRLGGHSLLATQVLSRLRTQIDTNLTVAAIFANPTIAELAAAIEKQPGTNDEDVTLLLEELETLSDQEASSQLAGE